MQTAQQKIQPRKMYSKKIPSPPVVSTLNTLVPKLKQDFPLLNTSKIVYLDSAATTQKPQVVIDALQTYYTTTNANVHRGIYTIAEQATRQYEDAREIVAKFLMAEPQEIIFTSGATEGINLIARALEQKIKKGDEIVLTVLEHHANLIPWQQLARRKKAVLKFIEITKDLQLDLQDARKKITSKTAVVAFTAMSNVLGTIPPLFEIVALAKQVGAITVIDAAQYVQHKKINVTELDCDFLVFSAHKLFGPTGLGVLYGKKSLLEKYDPVVFGGEMIKQVTYEQAQWNDLPWKWEAGTPKIAQVIAFSAAIKYFQNLPREELELYLLSLADYTKQQLEKIPGLIIINRAIRSPIITFTLEYAHAHDVAQVLNQYNVCVRAGHHCAMPLHTKLKLNATVRVSLALYNTPEDITQLSKGLQRVSQLFQ